MDRLGPPAPKLGAIGTSVTIVSALAGLKERHTVMHDKRKVPLVRKLGGAQHELRCVQ